MGEKLKISKSGKSKYGWWILVTEGEEKSFKGVSEAVSNYVLGKLPCEIEVEEVIKDKGKDIISRVKILGKLEQEYKPEVQQRDEQPETVKPDNYFKPASEVVSEPYFKEDYWRNKGELDIQKQKEILSEFCIREAIQLIGENNKSFEAEKIRPTKNNVYSHAVIICDLVKDLVKYQDATEE